MRAPFLALVRPANVLMAAAGVAVGGVVAVGIERLALPMLGSNLPVVVPLAAAAGSAALFTAAGNVLNDYFDRDTDAVNHPDRPIPAGLVTPIQARRLAVTLFLVSFVALPFVGTSALVVLWALNLVAMVAYERTYKGRGLSGNVLIAYLVGSLFLFGGVATTPVVPSEALRVGVLALLAAVATLGREIVKDIEDVAGDVDRVTLPMRMGVGPAATVAAALFGAGVALSVVPALARVLGIEYIVVVAIADGIFIYAAAVSAHRPAASQRAAKYAMLVALLAFLLGGLT